MKSYIFICDTYSSEQKSTKSSEIVISEICNNIKDKNSECLIFAKNTIKSGHLSNVILKILENKNFILRAFSDLFFGFFILRKQKIPKNSVLIFYTPPPIIPFVYLFLNSNLNNKKIFFVRDVFPLCMKQYFNNFVYNIFNYMQNYILKKADRILIESKFQKKFFINYKNIFVLKNPINKKRISSIKFIKNKNVQSINGIYFGNYGYQHQNKNFEKFLDLSKENNILCKYFGPKDINLNFFSKNKPIKFNNSNKILKNISFQLSSVNHLVETNPLPYKVVELAALGIPPIFFASKKHYFHNEIKKFNMGISISSLEELMNLFNNKKQIHNLNFELLGINAKRYMYKNHFFNIGDRKLFE